VNPSPYFSENAPPSIGAAVAPNTSPTSVTSPIEVAANSAGTLPVGTSTMINDPSPCPLFARNTIPANNHACE
jgi:hypothetical protein